MRRTGDESARTQPVHDETRLPGFAFEDERFYRVHSAFLLAAVWVDLHRQRVEAGEESDWVPYIEYASMVAPGIVEGDFPL